MLEVLEAVAAAVGEERVGVRLCPYNIYMDATDSIDAAVEKNVWLMEELRRRLPGLAYIHMVRRRSSSFSFSGAYDVRVAVRHENCTCMVRWGQHALHGAAVYNSQALPCLQA
jgi:2,4-dienoyl-CoA reductase-like NADH-dependent reductase (Old Yellow Enzyme family)